MSRQRQWSLISLVLITMLVLGTGGAHASSTPYHASSVTARQAAPQVNSAPADCLVYFTDERGKGTQLNTVAIHTGTVTALGAFVPDLHIHSLAIHPSSEVLYAASAGRNSDDGKLYVVDSQTGAFSLVGGTGFIGLESIAFRATDSTLWGWVAHVGLVQIDPATGAASLRLAADRRIKYLEEIVWSRDGALLYGSEGSNLWGFDLGSGTVQLVARNLPGFVQSIAPRPDGLLMGMLQGTNTVGLFSYDPAQQKVMSRQKLTAKIKNIEAAAWPAGCGNPSPGGKASMITSVTLDKRTLCVGESLLVTVTASHPESPQNPVDILVNEKVGSPQAIQFLGAPGPRWIHVTAATREHYVDSRREQVNLVACGEAIESPILFTRPNQYHASVVDFEVANAAHFNTPGAIYEWAFGDGQSLQTTVPYITHDYTDSIVRDQTYTVLQAGLTIRRPDLADATTRKTITLWNTYALNKQRGFLQPRIAGSDRLQPTGDSLSGTYTITNLEDAPIQLSSRQIEYQYCDMQRDPVLLPPEDQALEVGGRQQVTQQLTLAAASLPGDVCGIGLHLSGRSTDALSIYASIYMDVRDNPLEKRQLTDGAMIQLLNQIAQQRLVADPSLITDEDISRLAHEGKISLPAEPEGASLSLLSATDSGAATSAAPADADVDEICIPGEEPPRPGVSCQITGQWTVTSPRIKNARKGEVLLTAGCGPVGTMLRKVSPPQIYAHAGIMTQNYYQVRHSTAWVPRYSDYLQGFQETKGIRADVLGQGWPGAITQSIDEAYSGQYLRDPESQKLYRVDGAFSPSTTRCGEDMAIIPNVVAKPVPGLYPQWKETLKAAAEAALQITAHYRFYAYTKGDIATDRVFDGAAGWAAGPPATWAAACSQFVWAAFKMLNIELEGRLERADQHPSGAEVDPATADGQYYYNEPERQEAAARLYDNIYDTAIQTVDTKRQDIPLIGWFNPLGVTTWTLNAITDAADNAAQQVANCFAFDWCAPDAKDSDRFRQPGVGRTVSPSDILLWDIWGAPARSVAGTPVPEITAYNEEAHYQPARYEQISRWQISEGAGAVTGQVLYNGSPEPDVHVEIVGISGRTNANGEFRLEGIPAGKYEIQASKDVFGQIVSDVKDVTIEAGKTVTVSLALRIPPPPPIPAQFYRKVVISGNMHLKDDETFGDEEHDFLFSREVQLDPSIRRQDIHMPYCWGDEVVGILDLHLELQNDGVTVAVVGDATLKEGTGCGEDQDTREHQAVDLMALAPGDRQDAHRFLTWSGGDEMRLDFTITNEQQPPTAPQFRRTVHISGISVLVDDELFGYEYHQFPFDREVPLSPPFPHQDVHIVHCAGDEVVGILDLHLDLQSDGVTVKLTGDSILKEGTGCGEDQETRASASLDRTIAPERSENLSVGPVTWSGGDTLSAFYTVSNRQRIGVEP